MKLNCAVLAEHVESSLWIIRLYTLSFSLTHRGNNNNNKNQKQYTDSHLSNTGNSNFEMCFLMCILR